MDYKGNQNGSALYQEADISSKRIFGNHTLCAQFLRDYSGLPILANVQPEDIEDVSERYHLFREVELQSDTVKKVDFTYSLVRTRDYSNEELLSKEDAISLLMLLNKIQRAKDIQELEGISSEKVNDILQMAPIDVVEIIVSTITNLCGRLNLTTSETSDLIKKVRDGNMGYLFENMEKMDIQLERRNTAEQRERAEKAEQKAEQLEEKMHSIFRMLISTYRQQGLSKEAVIQQLISEQQMEESEADKLLELFWK